MSYRRRRLVGAIVMVLLAVATVLLHPASYQPQVVPSVVDTKQATGAMGLLNGIAIKGRAPKTGYERTQFGDGWSTAAGCDTRNIILHRDLDDVTVNDRCQIVSGLLHDPYTGKDIRFVRGETSSQAVQIDHVVALSNAWQTGAQQLSAERREQLANDPLELLAVDGPTNEKKGDGDAATWLPPNKAFRCQYVERQIQVKHKYGLWVTPAEHDAMVRVLDTCGAT